MILHEITSSPLIFFGKINIFSRSVFSFSRYFYRVVSIVNDILNKGNSENKYLEHYFLFNIEFRHVF